MSMPITQQVNRQLAFARTLLRSIEHDSAKDNSASQSALHVDATQQAIVAALYRGLCLYLEELAQRLQEQGVPVGFSASETWLNFSARIRHAVSCCSAPEFRELESLSEDSASWLGGLLRDYERKTTYSTKSKESTLASPVDGIRLVNLDNDDEAQFMAGNRIESIIISFSELVQRHRESLQYY